MDGQILVEQNSTLNSTAADTPWLYKLAAEDINWVITSSFMIFTMQTGFGMLESGCVSIKNEVNIMMKNVVDIVLGGFTYWMFGFSFSFGRYSNSPFIAFGDFFMDPPLSEPLKGAMYTAFLFQMSFATTATTIVSGAMAERCNFKAYCIYSFLNTIVYCVPAGWIWGEHGFLKKMGVVDIAGSGPVHLVGGFSALASAMMLGPRFGRYDRGTEPLPLGSPVNAVMGLFVLWWGWLAFNSGSTYGLSGEKYQYAAKAAVMTVMASFGGGCSSIIYTLTMHKGKTNALDIINGILGSLVSVTAGCFLYEAWEAILIGAIGSILVCTVMPLLDKIGIDDPVGASSVHGVGGTWGVIAVGLFANNPFPLQTTNGRSGLLKSKCWYLLGMQVLSAVCLAVWAFSVSILLLGLINMVIKIRMDIHEELLGADLVEHGVKHRQVGVTAALSALQPHLVLDSFNQQSELGTNPGHDLNVKLIKLMSKQCGYRISKILTKISKNKKYGVTNLKKLFPPQKLQRKKDVDKRTGDFKFPKSPTNIKFAW